jgi:hypothetical protein
VSKPKVQSFVPFVAGGSQIVVSLRLSHAIPLLIPCSIPLHVINFAQDDQDKIPGNETEQDLVSSAIEGLVVGLIDLMSFISNFLELRAAGLTFEDMIELTCTHIL